MFHPVVARWFAETLGSPTSAQQRGWESIRRGDHTLIAAPTGSGKTLAAFLTAIDDLVREGAGGVLPDEVRVVYISPLKALSADIHRNLVEPRRAVLQLARAEGLPVPPITAAVRTGDTTSSERAGMLRRPPHILVTTPESLYLLLTSERSRQMLRTARTVIVDEIHAVIGTRRGAHLALSLERLQQLADRPLLRLGLSATQKPVEDVARYLVGHDAGRGPCTIVDEGHRRTIDLAIEMPRSPLDAVMAHEVWEEYYDRLAELIEAHTTTLVFVNTRRLAERLARHLSERLGADRVTAHHGSLSKETRLDAEQRLKTGRLKALVATASLELGIDIGHVDLVCQIGSPHRISTLLQRVGRAGHTVKGLPKGRLLPTSRDDLIECVALVRAVGHGELDRIVTHDAPVDVLAQQIAAEVACRDYGEDELFALVARAWPYRALTRAGFDAVVAMVANGWSTQRGRRAALVHRDEVHATLRGRRSTRLLALTSGGAIPEMADYRVLLEPDETFLGTLNEDFAIESMAGDIFQLGNASWQITRVGAGVVRVADAHGAPPNIPFWFGEAPARSDELSKAVSDLRSATDRRLGTRIAAASDAVADDDLASWLAQDAGVGREAAEQTAAYLQDGWRTLGAIPSQETLVLERFFDESGGMQLVLHAPFGSRVNKAWGLALRKRFCRQFNFELQAAATEDAVLLSLGPQHSFPLADVFRYLHPATVTDILIQALLDAPVFQTRWRWNATISLAVPRNRTGRKVPPQIQRMQAEDLMAAAFPDAAACLENIPGDRQIPDHPLVQQTIRDCLEDAMDIQGLSAILERIHAGGMRCLARDTPEPSVFAHEILNARPYAFLDDAPLEERRARAVQTRRAGDIASSELGALDASAIARVRDEERPDPRDADELHDVLLTVGCLRDDELSAWSDALEPGHSLPSAAAELAARGRATRVAVGAANLWAAAERLPEILALHPDAVPTPAISVPTSRTATTWTREDGLRELVRGRMSICGPIQASALASLFAVDEADVDGALLALEAEGVILRGAFTPGVRGLEWCDRRLLARIHRYTLNRLRAEIAPVSAAEFVRFLFAWQHAHPSAKLSGLEGVRAVLAQLDGTELPARAWERQVLPARVSDFAPAMLDTLCLTGEIAWARLSSGPTQVVGATPIAIFLREHGDEWLGLRRDVAGPVLSDPPSLSHPPARLDPPASSVIECLRRRGASFAHEIAAACGMSGDQVRAALRDLVAAGLVSSDGFAGLRSIISRTPVLDPRRPQADRAGRWFALSSPTSTDGRAAAVEAFAWTLLRRYGIVFRRLLGREATDVPWRELARVYRRLEARGEIRGGRFVGGMSGEQFALPEAVERLREVRRSGPDDELIVISGADPLNLTGVLTSDERVRVSTGTRIVYRNGVALAAMEGDMLRIITPVDPAIASEVAAAAAGRRVPVVSGYVGRR
jgi:ATP-dependent Lhr-like helicase